MTEAIIVALITGAAAVISQLLIARANARELVAKIDKQSEISDEKIRGEINVIKADIRTLSNKVEAHNRLVERTYKLETRCSVLEDRINNHVN